MKYPAGNDKIFILSLWDVRLFDSDVRRDEKKPLLNKTITIGTNYLDFREDHGWIEDARSDISILYNLFLIRLFVCVLIRP